MKSLQNCTSDSAISGALISSNPIGKIRLIADNVLISGLMWTSQCGQTMTSESNAATIL